MVDKVKILIIEDDQYISNFIKVSLQKSNYDVFVSTTAAEGMFLFSSYKPDILLLDLGLPDQDGLEIIKSLREVSEVPILVVSARGQELEKIEALDLGASDYISKPFHMGELMARIRVAERYLSLGSGPSLGQTNTFTCDYLHVDFEKRLVEIDGEEIHLTPIEYKLLLLLIANRGKVLTHNYIVKKIWGYENESDTNSVRVFMANLRRKIEKDSAKHRFIMTEVGVGYRFSDE
ncbi:response regulator [Acidaminobacter hydrogenoformans]|uniref:Stage 0 sporulation protein A homolog n=1 Tax=Acidaminobacter hydrogenoformans DSM 2784 TaxID=1120920 RepID=A0A1G5S6E9_9FIRM|nr:response regulator transcription factor [Acidaminobacter hydrogenoformans]SCZ81788.1 two component transcriptional regulator, winged helix family [Acidaminobacter hydrogenoformans DSM 2784]